MREIKFRVWDTIKHVFLPNLQNLTFDINWDDSMPSCEGKSKWCGLYELSQIDTVPKRYIIQQFTGFKDRFNQEIYEGDKLNVTQFYDGNNIINNDYVFFDIKDGLWWVGTTPMTYLYFQDIYITGHID